MAESEQQFRQQYEKEGLEATVREARRGQYLGAAICFAAVIGAAFSAYVGAHWAVSAALVGVPVLGMVLAVIRPRSKD